MTYSIDNPAPASLQWHTNQALNAVLADARRAVKMLTVMADDNIGHAEAHEAYGIAKQDRVMARKLHKALALLQDCER